MTDLRIRLLLARHGESEMNRQGMLYGRLDPGITDEGRAQAAALAQLLADIEIAALYASPLRRAQETAAIVGERLAMTPVVHEGLYEQAFGDWEGKTPHEVIGPDRTLWRAWFARHAYHPPNGESLDQVAERGLKWLAEVEAAHPGQTVLAVAHAGWLQALLSALLDLPQRSFWPFRIKQAGLADIALFPEGPVVLSINGEPARRFVG